MCIRDSACGISREYYNRIEKGKFPLTEELKETLEKQIERFNPQEPLFLLIDYFRVRFPTTDALKTVSYTHLDVYKRQVLVVCMLLIPVRKVIDIEPFKTVVNIKLFFMFILYSMYAGI